MAESVETAAGPSTSYTCLACRVGFSNGDAQRTHYKTDWHRYNLKRKIANMPAITAQAFRDRVVAQSEEEARNATAQPFKAHVRLCAR
jgi:pre-60S factor REI1